ncbi:MAG: ankyrin repeat domain-containing protein [Verrucomicrobia bacterium]|nr:ankyrin repeat domain-containing protein [Verrucomicrobiota bacterium]MBS0636654.1 ankyrin repeat domain-containing protein [Verrucomicrobiota bacterium]
MSVVGLGESRSYSYEDFGLPEKKTLEGSFAFITQAIKGEKHDVLDRVRQGGREFTHLQDADGNTLLHLVFTITDPALRSKLLCFLCDLGCDLNVLNVQGKAPLHLAIGDQDLESTVLLLTTYGADLYIPNKNGKLAKNPEIIAFLKERIDEDQTQRWIVTPMQELGYRVDEICNGYAAMGMQAILADDMQTFDRRAIKLRALNSSLFTKNVKLLSDEERQERTQILAFCDGVALYQKGYSDENRGFLVNRVGVQDNSVVAKELAPLDLVKKEGEICKVDAFSDVFTRDELVVYFSHIRNVVEEAMFPIAITLSCKNHRTNVGYSPLYKRWYLVDVNFPPTHHKQDIRELVEDIFTKYRNDSVMVVTCEVFTTEKNAKIKEGIFTTHEVTVEKAALSDSWGNTWLIRAAERGDLQTVQALLSHGAAINQITNLGATALSLAAEHGRVDVVSHLLTKNADVNIPDTDGVTPLIFAAESGHSEVVKLLVSAVADIDTAAKSGDTALMMACQNGYEDAVECLLMHNANATLFREDGHNALGLATQHGHEEVVRLLVTHNPDLVNLPNKSGTTALLLAIAMGHEQLAQFLIEQNADVNLAHASGFTPLHAAASSGNINLVRLILSKKPNVHKATDEGDTALHLAEGLGFKEIADLLRDYWGQA